MKTVLSCLHFLAFVIVSLSEPQSDECATEIKKIQLLEKQIVQQQDEIRALKRQSVELERISMLKVGSQVYGMTNKLVSHALSSTDLDDKLVAHISNGATTAKEATKKFTAGMVRKVSSVNYTQHYEKVASSGAFQTLKKKSEVFQPYMEKIRPVVSTACGIVGHVEPFFTQAKDVCQPVIFKAVEKGSDAVEKHVLPALKGGSVRAIGSAFDAGLSKVNSTLTPVYERAGQMAPDYIGVLPSHPIDRVLFIATLVVLFYYGLFLTHFILRLMLRVLGRTTLMSWFLFRVLVMLPLKLLWRTFNLVLWILTGFYCCGICRARKNVQRNDVKERKNGHSKGENGSSKVTVAEAIGILEMAKKSGKVNQGLKSLVGFVKNGKPMSKPSVVAGKHLTKQVLLDACKKLNIDATGAGL